ncbi:putative peptidoglycan-binding domain-containing protein [Rivularia sp. PCC 7116]|uniref:peptidoglycan-binding domain-containing protein n=1 Tax=Rivularia sp. PCC 7116 TaxID=373994 RepID=UPI00029F1D3D|nr:peptidoglycan-binding protein [Rivularia sp. PCC 7116]AFY55900.1 putative peptidoglycan-binding domain-containing protein [Rivularia sp. PCC 7116]
MTTSLIVLEAGAAGLKVTKLQEALKQLNFYFSSIDGIFGTKTKAAVVKFQQPYSHLPNNGLVDAETILQLDEDVWLSAKEVLREGCTGEDVKALQEIFTVFDLHTLIVDGYFGRKTKEAVIWFQQNWGLQADGIVGKQTWAGLYRHQVHDIPYEDRVKAFFGELDTESFIKLPLQKGDKGNDVLILQKFFNHASGSTHGILEDGDFGQATEQAVQTFQQRNGLTSDGCVGMQTYQAMLWEGLNQQLINELLSIRKSKSIDFSNGNEYEVIEDAAIRGETVIHRFEVAPGQDFRIVITSVENNAIFELFKVGEPRMYAEKASNIRLFLEAGEYYFTVGAIRGNATYKLKVESVSC